MVPPPAAVSLLPGRTARGFRTPGGVLGLSGSVGRVSPFARCKRAGRRARAYVGNREPTRLQLREPVAQLRRVQCKCGRSDWPAACKPQAGLLVAFALACRAVTPFFMLAHLPFARLLVLLLLHFNGLNKSVAPGLQIRIKDGCV